jgi:predicted PurR-regulated permease PerM
MFFLWRDWDRLIKKLHQLIHLRKHHEAHIMSKMNDMTYAIVYGNFIVALIQGAVGALGFMIFGVPSPLVWGLVMAFFSLIHIIGTPVVWVPASLLLILDGISSASNNEIIRGVGLFLYGLIIISTIDNILKPKIIGGRGNIHPVLVLIGVLGGIGLFGLIGIIIGPLILGLFNVFIDIFEEEMKFNS